ncbi:MAG TPA: EAL domain-containing protein [Steroidobacteraceae bacterium]|nr:EAL domain-containing protein [Steroidobacteraceae bacterium]
MSAGVWRRHSWWLLPLLAATVVALIGARLVTLSVRERSEQLRRTAQSAVLRHTSRIEGELAALAAAARAAPPERGHFSMSTDGTVLHASGDAATASALAREWAADPAARQPDAVLFGPIRYGSEWIVAARAAAPSTPAAVAAPSGEARADGPPPATPAASRAWSVSYENLESLLARAGFGTLVNERYDFQLSQRDRLTRGQRVFLSSQPGTLADPITGIIHQPGAAAGKAAVPFLTLAIRPRTGWYPVRELAAEAGLLMLLVWTVAFGAYDLTHTLQRTRSALAVTRKRLHVVNERLAGEIEQRESLQRSFEHARYHDVFTGLPNRRYFMDQLDRALRDIRTRRRQRIAVALIDIERLRLISDTLGHTAGDELLLQAAQRCAQVLGITEHALARWSADQLAVLVKEVTSAAVAQELADRLQEACHRPYELRQHRLSVSARVGFASVDSGLQRAEDTLREADLAVAMARQQQRPRALAYAPGMAGAAVSLVSLEADLHVALDRREFRLLFQPIVDLRAGRVVGAEALLRWRHPVEGLLTPDKFLSIAEEAGVIVPVTRWVIQRVCRLAAEWRQRLPNREDFYISVNLSAAVLRSPGLREYIAQLLEDTQIPAASLKFELSESGLVSNVAAARAVLDAFHDMGIELMLDDFGTGYSSLSYLQLFPFDYVKIDRPFVSRTGSERANNAITAAILQMASNLGLRAVAEVVETEAAAQTLLQMGCRFGQGFFFSPPVDAEAAFQQLRSTTRVAMSETGREPESGTAAVDETQDDSPTVMLPAGMILESRIRDDSDPAEDETPGAYPQR